MSPFYSDKQRRFYFAVIAPMGELGGKMASYIFDPIAKALGSDKVEDEDTINRIKEALKDSEHVALLTPDEVGRIKNIDLDPTLQGKMVKILIEGITSSGFAKIVSDAAGLFLTKVKLTSLETANISSKKGKRIEKTREVVEIDKKTKEKKTRKEDIWGYHAGVDIGTGKVKNLDAPTPVEGVVIYAGEYNGYGKVVEIIGKDNKIRRFAHLERCSVSLGDEIKSWSSVGIIGNTGKKGMPVHLHYEKRKNYLFFKSGKDLTEMTYDDISKYGPKALDRITKIDGLAKSRTMFADDGLRFDGKEKLEEKDHTQSLNPLDEAKTIKDYINQSQKVKEIATIAIKQFCIDEKKAITALKAIENKEKPARSNKVSGKTIKIKPGK